MTTTKDDQPLNREPPPNGATNGRVPEETRTSGTPAASQGDMKSEAEPSQEFDPWKFGVHPVAADLRAEILAHGFPASPGRGDFWEEVGKAKPSEVAPSAPQGAKKAERETDTLRLQRRERVPVENPFRAMAPWLALATIGTIILLWLLMGRDKSKPTALEPAGDSITAPALPGASTTAERAPAAVEHARTTPEPQPPVTTSGTPSSLAPEAAKPEERTERKPIKRGSPGSLGTPKPPTPAPASETPDSPPKKLPEPASTTGKKLQLEPR